MEWDLSRETFTSFVILKHFATEYSLGSCGLRQNCQFVVDYVTFPDFYQLFEGFTDAY